MPIYSFYRIVKDIIRTIFGGKFWRKFLIIILISIAIWFILHNKGYCLETTEDINYEVRSYYDNVVNDAILRLNKNWDSLSDNWKNYFLNNENTFYFYYGWSDGSQYNNGRPLSNTQLNVARLPRGNFLNTASATTDDYLGVETYTMYVRPQTVGGYFSNNTWTPGQNNTVYLPQFVTYYISPNWTTFINAKINGDNETIISLLNDIKSQNDTILEEMTQDVQDTSQGVVDTSIVDTSGTEQATQNVQSLLNIIKGFYDNIGDEVYTISFPIKDTSFTIRSDIISSHIRGTWLATFLNTFWYFIFGMYYLIFLFRIGKWLADGSLFEERWRT